MRDILNLVRGAVSTKDLVPVLTHFHVYDGRVQGGNGRITIDAACTDLQGFSFTVPAVRFLKAVDACDGEPKLKLTEGGKLSISKGTFRAMLPLADCNTFPIVRKDEPAEFSYHRSENDAWKLLPTLRLLQPFIGEDASRPWSCGILFRDGYAWASNNVILARTPSPFPSCVLPVFAVDELLRIGQEPSAVTISDAWILFDFGDWWLRTQRLAGEWPNVAAFIPGSVTALPVLVTDLRAAVDKVLPFCPDPKLPVIKTTAEGVCTIDGTMSAQVSLDIDLPETCWRAEPLRTVLAVADTIVLDDYPKPCYWKGKGIDGVIVGMRL